MDVVFIYSLLLHAAPPQIEFDEMFIHNKTFGISRLRFLPKATGVRPIINLRSRARHGFCCKETSESVNRHLQDVFCVLNYEKVTVDDLISPVICT